MPPPKMTLLSLKPDSVLRFQRPTSSSNPQPQQVLTLTNESSSCVAFKVKTTAPKSYLVRPSSNTLKPGDEQQVTIIYQEKGASQANDQHRFLVQALQVSSTEVVSREHWLTDNLKDSIQEQRLSVEWSKEVDDAGSKPQGGSWRVPGQPADNHVGAGGDLEKKYQELEQYTTQLETKKQRLQAELDQLGSASPSNGGDGYKVQHLLLVAILSFLLTYSTKYLM